MLLYSGCCNQQRCIHCVLTTNLYPQIIISVQLSTLSKYIHKLSLGPPKYGGNILGVLMVKIPCCDNILINSQPFPFIKCYQLKDYKTERMIITGKIYIYLLQTPPAFMKMSITDFCRHGIKKYNWISTRQSFTFHCY